MKSNKQSYTLREHIYGFKSFSRCPSHSPSSVTHPFSVTLISFSIDFLYSGLLTPWTLHGLCLGAGAAWVAVIAVGTDGDLVTQEEITSNMHCFRRPERQGPEPGVLKHCFGSQSLCWEQLVWLPCVLKSIFPIKLDGHKLLKGIYCSPSPLRKKTERLCEMGTVMLAVQNCQADTEYTQLLTFLLHHVQPLLSI